MYNDLVPCITRQGPTLRSQMSLLQNVKKDSMFENVKAAGGPLFYCPPSPLSFDTLRNKSCTPWFNSLIKTGAKKKKPIPTSTSNNTSATTRTPITTAKSSTQPPKPAPTLKSTKTEPDSQCKLNSTYNLHLVNPT